MLIATAVIVGSTTLNITSNRSEIVPIEEAKPIVLPDISEIGKLKLYLRGVADKYGLDYDKLQYTVQNESGFNVEADNGTSVGIAQYTLDTWLGHCSLVDDRTDPYKSMDCMGKMFSMGMEYRWDAYCFHYYDSKCITLRGLYPK